MATAASSQPLTDIFSMPAATPDTSRSSLVPPMATSPAPSTSTVYLGPEDLEEALIKVAAQKRIFRPLPQSMPVEQRQRYWDRLVDFCLPRWRENEAMESEARKLLEERYHGPGQGEVASTRNRASPDAAEVPARKADSTRRLQFSKACTPVFIQEKESSERTTSAPRRSSSRRKAAQESQLSKTRTQMRALPERNKAPQNLEPKKKYLAAQAESDAFCMDSEGIRQLLKAAAELPKLALLECCQHKRFCSCNCKYNLWVWTTTGEAAYKEPKSLPERRSQALWEQTTIAGGRPSTVEERLRTTREKRLSCELPLPSSRDLEVEKRWMVGMGDEYGPASGCGSPKSPKRVYKCVRKDEDEPARDRGRARSRKRARRCETCARIELRCWE